MLSLAIPAWGQVTFDAVGPSASGAGATAASVTFNHTEGTCTNCVLIVGACFGTALSDSGVTATATYNGVSMTQIGVLIHSNGGTNGFAGAFYLVNPPAGSHNVVVTETGIGSMTFAAGSVSVNGADQTTPIAHNTSATGNSTNPAVTVTSATNNMALDLACSGSGFSATNQALQWRNNFSSASAAGNGQMDTASGAASVSFSNTTPNDGWAEIGIDIAAVAGSAVTISGTNSLGVAIDQNGYTVLNAVKSGSAFLNSKGITINPDGAMYYATSITAGSLINVIGLRINPDGAVVTSQTPSSAFLSSFSFLINPDGSLIISTTPSGAHLNSRGVLVNSNGATLVAIQ